MIAIGDSDSIETFTRLGFKKSENYADVYGFAAAEPAVFRMCETLRDMGVPFATHRHMGADYQVQYLREKGYVQGVFKRINFFGNDRDKSAPYRLEEF
ncbi:hypothetical protein NGR_c32330 [Sinorhizobium fredii NGR234]|uniref:Uncharacterized protein n=1 Tax=Sinorhizobium fredii (strain NBRC 101917 / NGR234) TaxID=394 RepID=C3MAH3_SINFN|nr:hypothetical protein NGR_c32330 [Sinorhizobium fredii NGR234]